MEPFIGTIMAFAFDHEPQGWMKCDGRLLPIEKYQALFALISTTYGGDGVKTFALPDLRGRTTVGMGRGTERQALDRGKTTKPQVLDVARAAPNTPVAQVEFPSPAIGLNYCIAVVGLWPAQQS